MLQRFYHNNTLFNIKNNVDFFIYKLLKSKVIFLFFGTLFFTKLFFLAQAHAQVTNLRGNMIALNGSTQYISTNSPLTTATNNITMEGWFNFQSTGGGGAICIFYNGDNFGNGYGLYLLNGRYQILQGGVQLLNTGVLPTLNTWTHLALTINSGVWTVYQDGNVILATSAGAPIAPTNNFRVGANRPGTSEFLNAQVDEVRFWNTTRTVTQLRENMHLTLQGNEAGLTAYYQFNEASGNAIDAIGANNATLQGVTPRTPSTLSVGGGVSKIVNVTNVTGGGVEIDLTTTNLEIDFNNASANPNAQIVVTQITAENPFNNTNSALSVFDGYWVVRNYGTNAGLSFNNIKAKILPTNNILNDDLTTPNNLKLYTRINNSGTSTWTQAGAANSADNVSKEINFSSPTNTFLGEFVVGSNPTNTNAFITTWITTDNTITIPTNTGTYNYDIKWENLTNSGVGNGNATSITGSYTITGLQNGSIYRVSITGTFPSIVFSYSSQSPKIRTIQQWGNIAWQSFQNSFAGCTNLTYTATDNPNMTSVSNMSNMFAGCTNFNGNIGTWNTSNVNSMSGMFSNATSFNQPLINWNVGNVTDMSFMFSGATSFNQSLGAALFAGWNTANVTNMNAMFSGATSFNQGIGVLNISNVTNMIGVLNNCGMNTFNYDATLSGFQFQAVNYSVKPNLTFGANNLKYCQGLNARNTLMLTRNWTFVGDALECPFITTWVTSTTTIMIPTIDTGYNYSIIWENISNLGVGNGSATGVTGNYTITGLTNGNTYRISIVGSFPRILFENLSNQAPKLRTIVQWGNIVWSSMERAFNGCSNLTTILTTEAPNLSNVSDMSNMFKDASQFNGNLSSWNVSNVTNMANMFANATSFNGNISNWNVSNVTNMSNMFAGATTFNQNINSWNVSSVTNMLAMFVNALSFNQDISSWNVGNVTDMSFMFTGLSTATSFNQNIGAWQLRSNVILNSMFNNSSINVANYEGILAGWAAQSVTGRTLGATGRQYCNTTNRNILISTKGWTITGDALFCPFITTWVTNTNSIAIPITGGGYNYNITWENLSNLGVGNGSATGITGNYTITGLTNGNTYQISITGSFPRIFCGIDITNASKLRTIVQWGSIAWTSMSSAFQSCSNLTTVPTTEAPNLSGVTNMTRMFENATQFNGNLSSWNVSNVTNMASMFANATSFNGNISNWNVSSVTNMLGMFVNATSFNQDISGWNVGNVTAMQSMFSSATAFNQNIGAWNVGNVTNMQDMFVSANAFNQNISNWNVSNVTNMQGVFANNNAFNQNISTWNVSNVTTMEFMFANATNFNQNIGAWQLRSNVILNSMFDNSGINIANYEGILAGWATQSVTGRILGATGRLYCNTTNRNILTSTKGWTITGDAIACPCVITLSTNVINDFLTDINTHSASQSFTISGTSLLADVALAINTPNWELSTNNITFTNTLNLTQNSGTLTGQPLTVFVRLKSGASIGNITATLTASSAGATSQTITLNGRVLNAMPQGVRGNMAFFNGTSGTLAETTSVLSTITNNFSIEMWAYFPNSNTSTVFSQGDGNGYALFIEDNKFKIYVTGVGVYDTFIGVPVGSWSHIAVVFTNGWNLIINGINVYSGTHALPITPSGRFTIASPVIGGNAGVIVDELRFWEGAISISQIRENMHLTLKGTENTLASYYQFNENIGVFIDAIKGNNATLSGSTSRITSQVAVASGGFHRRNVTTGLNSFTNVNVAINFTTAPADEFVAYQLRGNPFNGVNTANAGTNTPSCYWIVRQFGTNAVAYNQMNFTLPASNTISATDMATPSNLKLYKRPDNSVASFGASIANATTANNTTKVIEFAGLNETSFSQFEIGSTTSPLPITLLSFEGKRQDENSVLLEWKTATEINNKGFEVEISENGQDFQKIAFVDGAGNSNTIRNYELEIKNEKGGYFRLKQIDFGGGFSYSNIIFINGFSQEIKIYPNPVSEYFILENLPKNTKINIIDAVGREKLTTFTQENTLKINVSHWQKGLYLVKIGKVTKKIVVE